MPASVLNKIHQVTVRGQKIKIRTVDVTAKRKLGLAVLTYPELLAGELKVPFERTRKVEVTKGRLLLDASPPTYFSHQFYTEPGLARFSNLYMPPELDGRARLLEAYATKGHGLAVQLTSYSQLDEAEQQQLRSGLRMMGRHLIRAFDPFKYDAGKHFLLASDITDALGRINPQAMALKVEASAKRLGVTLEQIERNRRSIQKLQSSVEEIRQMRDGALGFVWRQLEQEPTRERVGKMEYHLKNSLAIKPFCFPARLALREITGSADAESFQLARRGFFAELALSQFDACLAEIEDDHRLYQGMQIELSDLLAQIFQLEVPGYTDLGQILSTHQRRLGTAMMLADQAVRTKELTEILAGMRHQIRYRTDPIWMPLEK